MRFAIDLQGAQASGRKRGVGRYSLALAEAMLRCGRGHEFIVLLNATMAESAAEISDRLAHYLPPERVHQIELPPGIAEIGSANLWRTRTAELLREYAIAGLQVDALHISSLFEGLGHDATTSIGMLETGPPVAITHYDLIPYIQQSEYLQEPHTRRWYGRKLQSLKRADKLLAISQYAAEEAREALRLEPDRVVVIGAGIDPFFRAGCISAAEITELRRRHRLADGFVLYTGGADPRKNLDQLVRAFARLPDTLRNRYRLALVGEVTAEQRDRVLAQALRAGVSTEAICWLGWVGEAVLRALYSACDVFVFPSLHEGFGLPAAEAMACGAPVIASNTTSLPEVVGDAAALFDPRDASSLASLLERVLTDGEFKERLKASGLAQVRRFRWDDVACRAIAGLQDLAVSRRSQRPSAGGGLSRPALAVVLETAHLLPIGFLLDLSASYEVTCIAEKTEAWGRLAADGISVRSQAWFASNIATFDRVLYVVDQARAAGCPEVIGWRPGVAFLLPPGPGTVASDQLRHEIDACVDLMSRVQGLVVTSKESLAAIRDRMGNDAGLAVWPIPEGATVSSTESEQLYRQTIECFGADWERTRLWRLATAIASIPELPPEATDEFPTFAKTIVLNEPRVGPRQLVLDVTVMVQADVGTGIQRVTGKIIRELARATPSGYRIELTRLQDGTYVYAREYASALLGWPSPSRTDEPVDLRRGDLFIGLDLVFDVASTVERMRAARRRGVRSIFVIYDLLPSRLPDMFGPGIPETFRHWLRTVVTESDGLLCISRAVADDLRSWIDENQVAVSRPVRIGWFHQGADILHEPSRGGDEGRDLLTELSSRPWVLTVSTVEPRKGLRQLLAAFDLLWQKGFDAALVIVGRQGWLMEDFVAELDRHPERERRLFWCRSISDGWLSRLYGEASLLVAPSIGEGFGLPLVEAAQHGLPALARDIPVFREVTRGRATYFKGDTAAVLAAAIEDCLNLVRDRGKEALPSVATFQTWREAAAQMLAVILQDHWYLVGYPGQDGADPISWSRSSSRRIEGDLPSGG